MSHVEEIVETPPESPPSGSQGLSRSLRARLRERREQIDRSVAEVFPVPGWDDLFAVRLRKIGADKMLGIEEKHSKVRDRRLRNLYMNADAIVAGTDGFYALDDHDGKVPDPDTPTLDGISWATIARAADETLAEDITPRQAVISIMTDLQLGRLARDWSEWMERGRSDVDSELERDFPGTR